MPYISPRQYRTCVATAVALLSSLVASAQQTDYARQFNNPGPAQTAAALHALPEKSQQVIERLSKLSDLPVGEWR